MAEPRINRQLDVIIIPVGMLRAAAERYVAYAQGTPEAAYEVEAVEQALADALVMEVERLIARGELLELPPRALEMRQERLVRARRAAAIAAEFNGAFWAS
jgi:hypothetical protein